MLTACLESAAALDPPPGEVLVAVDGADTGVEALARQHAFRLVICRDAPGVSATRNAGVEAARGEIVVFADSDILLPRDFVARAHRAFADHPEAAAIFGSYDAAPAAPGLLSRYRNLLHHYTHQNGNCEAQTFWAGCGAIRRDVFRDVGGFDRSFVVPSVEDIELGYRLRRTGHRIRLVPDWQVKHLKHWRGCELVKADVFRRAAPWTALLLAGKRFDNDLNIGHTARVSAVLVCAAIPALLAAPWWPVLGVVALLLLVGCAVFNWPFYRFLARDNGWPFALASIPWHWLYFLCSAVGFAIGAAQHYTRRRSG